ncbi:MAG: PrsW family intramembrane metalloprotease [Candidatus Cloacimonetes bacterium]|nr:PrsW family intramembrane metalloprotease [Candidatus Cloacimonadota bacterium]
MILLINCIFSALLVTLLMWLDRYEKEDITTMMKVFMGTIFATSLYAIAISWIITSFNTITIVVVAPVLEETWKFLIFIMVLHKFRREVNESFDAIMYMGVIALGFAFYENITYYVSATWNSFLLSNLSANSSYFNESLYNIFLARLVPGHLLFDIIAISIYGLSFKSGHKEVRLFFSWLTAIILHGIWNLSVRSNTVFAVYCFLLAGGAIYAVIKLLSISRFKLEPQFGDETLIPDKSTYDWSYYLLTWIFVIICGAVSLLVTYVIESIVITFIN